MYLSRLYIKNYRSIQEADLKFEKGKNIIVGRNNAGKSNIIKALDILLGENSPTWDKSENITEHDFYTWKETVDAQEVIKVADEIHLWCELTRDEGEEFNYEALYDCTGFYIYCIPPENRYEPKEPRRINREHLPTNPELIFDIDENDWQTRDYIDLKKRDQQVLEKQFSNKHFFAFSLFASRDAKGKIKKSMRLLYRETPDHSWILAFRANIRCELLQSAIIQSFRDPQNQLRLTPWTWYGKLMKHLTTRQNRSSDLQIAFEKVKGVADEIFSEIKTTVVNSSLDVAFPGTDLFFQFNADSQTDLYKSCLIYIDDGFKSQLTDKGSGIQSATIIGLFKYYTKYVSTRTSALLCIEEPELYLHPHARRVISDRLDDFLDAGNNQVILTTHSTEFLRSTAPDLNIILINKEKEGSKAKPIKIQRLKNLLLDNNQNELFFADKVIICEGYDGHLLRAITRVLFPKKLDEQNISIVDVGGKDRISQFMKLVLQLGLKCFVLTDFDYLLRDKSEAATHYGKSHESLLSCPTAFFSQTCIAGQDFGQWQSKIEKMRNALKSQNEGLFYTAKRASDFQNDELTTLLTALRKKGIGILSGEIEDLATDSSLMSSRNKKLTLETIFDLNERLNAGQPLKEILNLTEVTEFLEAVFGTI